MRIKCLRIFPDICASTWCWLSSNSTRNIALGKVSSTFAMTSIASSFAISSQVEVSTPADKLRIIASAPQVCQAEAQRDGLHGYRLRGAGVDHGQHFRAVLGD